MGDGLYLRRFKVGDIVVNCWDSEPPYRGFDTQALHDRIAELERENERLRKAHHGVLYRLIDSNPFTTGWAMGYLVMGFTTFVLWLCK